jgi:hypothetical protein
MIRINYIYVNPKISGKLPDGKLSPGEFREIRETSRRETFSRRISGNPGNFLMRKFMYVFYTTIYYVFL